MDSVKRWTLCLLTAIGALGACSVQTTAYDNVGAIYVTTDRTSSYHFLDKSAEYNYIYPASRISGQEFPPDKSDTTPSFFTRDCSNSGFRCLAIDDQAMAVPRRRLASKDSYVVAGNRLSVVECMRGYHDICQVALIKSECIYSAAAKGCILTSDQKDPNERLWLLFFIYNEDFGVTSFGIAPAAANGAPMPEMLSWAKTYNLVGENGLLKATPSKN
jgi:hypothetical protein